VLIPDNCYTMHPVGDIPLEVFNEFAGDADMPVGERRRLVMFRTRPELRRTWHAALAMTSTGEDVRVWVRSAPCGLRCYCSAEIELRGED